MDTSPQKNLVNAWEKELRWVAGELHDDLSQRIAAALIDLHHIKRSLARNMEELEAMTTNLGRVCDDIQNLTHALHPSILEHQNLASAMEMECRGFSRRRELKVTFSTSGLRPGLSYDSSLCLYRIAQEALHNVAKHAGTDEAEVTLTEVPEGVLLIIRDEGDGFDPEGAKNKHTIGLTSMRERVDLVGGKITIDSLRGRGTEVRVVVPRSGRAED